MRLKKKKCSFLLTSVSYLGHVRSAECLHTKAPEPRNVVELRSFLGMVTTLLVVVEINPVAVRTEAEKTFLSGQEPAIIRQSPHTFTTDFWHVMHHPLDWELSCPTKCLMVRKTSGFLISNSNLSREKLLTPWQGGTRRWRGTYMDGDLKSRQITIDTHLLCISSNPNDGLW